MAKPTSTNGTKRTTAPDAQPPVQRDDGVSGVQAASRPEIALYGALARQVFIRFKALLMEPTSFTYAERHDKIEYIYKKLT